MNVSVKKKKSHKKKTIFLISMLIIPVIHWLIFWLYVNLDSILLSFQFARGGWTLYNFQILFRDLGMGDAVLLQAFRNTMTFFFINILLIMPLCFLVSYLLYRKIRGFAVFRIIIFLPQIISAVVLTTAFSNFVAPNGPVGIMLENFGVKEIPQFLGNSSYALQTIIFYTVWTGIGGNMLLFSGAMSRIPLEIIESARIDGCYFLRELYHIILPMIWPTLSMIIIFACTGIFSSSGPILLFTKGKYNTYTLAYWIYEQVYVNNSYNNVAAAGLFFTCIGIPFILLVRKLLDKVPLSEY